VADVVMLDEAVDVSVVDGDEISHPKKVPEACRVTRSLSAAVSLSHSAASWVSILIMPPLRQCMASVNRSPGKFSLVSGNCVISRAASTSETMVPSHALRLPSASANW
jgi:hypothetical protein